MNTKNVREGSLHILSLVIVSATVGFLVVLVLKEIPSANKDALLLALGALLSAFGSVVGYFFGSSKGSADKNELMKPAEDKNQLKLPGVSLWLLLPLLALSVAGCSFSRIQRGDATAVNLRCFWHTEGFEFEATTNGGVRIRLQKSNPDAAALAAVAEGVAKGAMKGVAP